MDETGAISVTQNLGGTGPVVTKRLFAQQTGLTEETIRGMVERGYLPTVKIGKHRMVNVALLTKECLDQLFEQ